MNNGPSVNTVCIAPNNPFSTIYYYYPNYNFLFLLLVLVHCVVFVICIKIMHGYNSKGQYFCKFCYNTATTPITFSPSLPLRASRSGDNFGMFSSFSLNDRDNFCISGSIHQPPTAEDEDVAVFPPRNPQETRSSLHSAIPQRSVVFLVRLTFRAAMMMIMLYRAGSCRELYYTQMMSCTTLPFPGVNNCLLFFVELFF